MSKQEVTTALPGTTDKTTEVFFTRDGAYVGNVGDQMQAAYERQPVEPRRENLNDLENTLRAMEDRVKDREKCIDDLAPQVHAAEVRVDKLKAAVAGMTEAVAERIPGSRVELKHLEIKYKFAVDAHAAFRQRLETSKVVLKSAKAIQLQWYKDHGKTLAHLRKLTAKV